MSLSKAQRGRYTIQSMQMEKTLRNHLMSLGFLNGTEVQVERNLGDRIIVKNKHNICSYGISGALAKNIQLLEKR